MTVTGDAGQLRETVTTPPHLTGRHSTATTTATAQITSGGAWHASELTTTTATTIATTTTTTTTTTTIGYMGTHCNETGGSTVLPGLLIIVCLFIKYLLQLSAEGRTYWSYQLFTNIRNCFLGSRDNKLGHI